VYTYLPKLEQPKLDDDQYQTHIDEIEKQQENITQLLQKANQAIKDSKFLDAIEHLKSLIKIKPKETQFIQKLALATYKSEFPSVISALTESLTIISKLNSQNSTDVETLGLTGAIYKRLWEQTRDIEMLNLAIKFYSRGFNVVNDYYTGENLALCYNLRAKLQSDPNEKTYDTLSALKIRKSIIDTLLGEISLPQFEQRSDKKWVYATLANCFLAINQVKDKEIYESKFALENPSKWELETYNNSQALLTNSLKA
jgi:hypothetical protein